MFSSAQREGGEADQHWETGAGETQEDRREKRVKSGEEERREWRERQLFTILTYLCSKSSVPELLPRDEVVLIHIVISTKPHDIIQNVPTQAAPVERAQDKSHT